jgi:hypothetical protein
LLVFFIAKNYAKNRYMFSGQFGLGFGGENPDVLGD